MLSPTGDSRLLIQTIFDYLFSSSTPQERHTRRIATKPKSCSPLIQLIDNNTFEVIEDLHEHTTWVTDETLQHIYSRARFTAAYNLITGENPDESTK